MSLVVACLAISFGSDDRVVAQTAASDQKKTTKKPDSTASKDVQVRDANPNRGTKKVSGDIWTREKLTGDWGGLCSDLADDGIKTDLRFIQYD